MIFIIIFILLSFQNTNILIVDALLDTSDYTNVHGLKQIYYSKEENKYDFQNLVAKVSGGDENEEASIVEKFRVLLGLRSFLNRTPSNDNSECASPAPSPSASNEVEAPAPAPAPIPVVHFHRHSHPPLYRLHSVSSTHKTQREDKGRVRRILITGIVSAGAVSLVCVLGLGWFCIKLRKHQKKPRSTLLVNGKTRGSSKCMKFKRSANNVNLNQSVDLFYLDSIALDIGQQQTASVEQTCEIVEKSPNRNKSNQELQRSEFDNVSSSSTREITSVHEDDADSTNHESDYFANSPSEHKIVPVEAPSSDDESFHSFGDSNSSQARLSNASVGSLSGRLENMSSNMSNISNENLSSAMDLQSQSIVEDQVLTPQCSSICQRNCIAPPPPPPPPPLPSISFPNFHYCPNSNGIRPKALCSSTLQSLSSPNKKFDSSSGPNQTLQGKLPSLPKSPSKPSQTQSGIPPPPCPPPIFKPINGSLKSPPPPPPSLFTPSGKDGSPLPKLKPLHWDKVRAAPDRSMVWDKLRSSSFE